MTNACDLFGTVYDIVAAVRVSGIDCRNIAIHQPKNDDAVIVTHDDGYLAWLGHDRNEYRLGPQSEALVAIFTKLKNTPKPAPVRELNIDITKARHTWKKACEDAARYANQHGGDLQLAEEYLIKSGFADKMFGIGSVTLPEAGRELSFLDAGDSCDLTICCEGGQCFISTWGQWLKNAEHKYSGENNVMRCPDCWGWTANSSNPLSRCEHCDCLIFGKRSA